MTNVASEAALLPGCDLWIVAETEASTWSRRIDWLLNFQVRRSQFHKSREVSAEVEALSREHEIDIPRIEAPAYLMVASGSLVPARQTVMVPFAKGSIDDWVQACHEVWVQLGRPLARIFLPDGVAPDFFSRQWPIDPDEGPRGVRGLELV